MRNKSQISNQASQTGYEEMKGDLSQKFIAGLIEHDQTKVSKSVNKFRNLVSKTGNNRAFNQDLSFGQNNQENVIKKDKIASNPYQPDNISVHQRIKYRRPMSFEKIPLNLHLTRKRKSEHIVGPPTNVIKETNTPDIGDLPYTLKNSFEEYTGQENVSRMSDEIEVTSYQTFNEDKSFDFQGKNLGIKRVNPKIYDIVNKCNTEQSDKIKQNESTA